MRNTLTCPSLVLLTLLDAYASHPQQQPVDSTTAAATATDASADNGRQTPRANCMACVQRQADSDVSGATQTEDVIISAPDACGSALHTMHDGFCNHLSTPMSSSGTYKAADHITKNTREKARIYLMGCVDHTRYLAKSR